MRACCAVYLIAVAGLVTACGGADDIAAENERVASSLTTEIEVDASGSGDERMVDVRCSRPKAGLFDCRAYKPLPGQQGAADMARYRVIDCYNGQWRAILEGGSQSAFPSYLQYDTASEGIKERCVTLDRRHAP